MIESAAQQSALPVDFFTRIIWQESRFQPDAVGPLTRSGEHALGIAQFMPGTAAERRLYAPFDPVQALPKSSAFLAELRDEFGNLGLTAAAYNAGPQRVRDYLAGERELPAETRNYVLAITGRPVEDWAFGSKDGPSGPKIAVLPSEAAPKNCQDLITQLEHESNPLLAEWQGRKVPSWCRALHHPDTSVCGPFHLLAVEPKTAAAIIPRSHVHLSSR